MAAFPGTHPSHHHPHQRTPSSVPEEMTLFDSLFFTPRPDQHFEAHAVSEAIRQTTEQLAAEAAPPVERKKKRRKKSIKDTIMVRSDDDPYLEMRLIDKEENDKVQTFKNGACGCLSKCSTQFQFETLLDSREYFQELEKEEHHRILKWVLLTHRKDSTTEKKKPEAKARKRASQSYFFHGSRVCKNTFCFAYATNIYTLKTLVREGDGVGLPQHGNKGRRPKHALSAQQIGLVKGFIIEYAVRNGRPRPGRLPSNPDAKVLPSDTTRRKVYEEYLKVPEGSNFNKISFVSFRKIWRMHCPFVTINKPIIDPRHRAQQDPKKPSPEGAPAKERKKKKKTPMSSDRMAQAREDPRKVPGGWTPTGPLAHHTPNFYSSVAQPLPQYG